MNGPPASSPGTLWLSSYARGAAQGDTKLGPMEQALKTGKPWASLSREWHTYTIEWQADHVSWWDVGPGG